MSKLRLRAKLLLLALVLLLAVGIALTVRACTPRTIVINGMTVQEWLIPEGDRARPGIQREIKYVVLHETGNKDVGADAKRHAEFLRYTNTSTTSWHYTVDDHSVYHHIPDDEVAWHASDHLKDPGGNLNGIGVELCVNADGDFEKTFDNAARLVAGLLNAYGLTVDDIRQHADFTEKNCPERIRKEGRMDEFRRRVAEYQ